METFESLEEKFRTEQLRLLRPCSGQGVLNLSGPTTTLRLTSTAHLKGQHSLTGWFDLLLERTNGEKVLVHNGITTSSKGIPHPHRGDWEYRIFPNIIAFDAAALLPKKKVGRLTFTADGLEDLFSYDLLEWQSLYKVDPMAKKAIKDLRKTERAYSRSYDTFSPREIYIVHELPVVLSIPVSDKKYEIYVGMSIHRKRNGIDIRPIVHASITFGAAVSIDDALDAAWAWRRFFNQIAMEPLPFTSLSCSARKRKAGQSSELYLPNVEARHRRSNPRLFTFRPGYVPYGEWKNRKKFALAMQKWLEADESRRLFRVRLDRVLEESLDTASPRLIAELCNAVDTLAEFKKSTKLTAGDIDTIVTAAEAAAQSAEIDIQPSRIKGVLSLLQHQSLPQKLKALIADLDIAPKKDLSRVMQLAQRFRTFDAHGEHLGEMTTPLVGLTLEALKNICVVWDQKTSGMPAAYEGRSLLAADAARFGIREICARLGQMKSSNT